MVFEKLFEKLSDLPVKGVSDEVARSVLEGKITILASATGSGKTLLQPARLAGYLQFNEDDDEPLVVLVPRRFLAVNAAETVAELAEKQIGVEVGYAVGAQAGDMARYSKYTKILYATYGYALASGLVWTTPHVILDEVHETSMDMSIIRAILYLRRSRGENVKVLEMSATMDANRQASYWSAIANTKVFQIDGKTHPCVLRHLPAGEIDQVTIDLILEGRKGVLVFRPGVGEVAETAEKISELALKVGLEIEVAQIYGEMDYAERADASKAASSGKAKVLVGTNVVESGVNIPWLDCGVTDGMGKEKSVRPETGATYLALTDLAQWRLQQQEGRVKRFCPGIFVLCSPLGFKERPMETVPEIKRLALTELVMHCAIFNLRAHDLHFDYIPDPQKVQEAEIKLQRLGLIDKDCKLTKAGRFVSDLPVGPETGTMLWYAREVGCLESALALVAVIEVGGIRNDFRFSHKIDNTSDYLDGMKALIRTLPLRGKENRDERKFAFETHNINKKRFYAAAQFVGDLERRLKCEADLDEFGKDDVLRRCIIAGSLDHLFKPSFRGVVSIKDSLNEYSIGNGAVVYRVQNGELCAGHLRVITPKDRTKLPFTVLEKVTLASIEDLEAIARVRPGIISTKEVQKESLFGGTISHYRQVRLFNEYVVAETFQWDEEVQQRPESRDSFFDRSPYGNNEVEDYYSRRTRRLLSDGPRLSLTEILQNMRSRHQPVEAVRPPPPPPTPAPPAPKPEPPRPAAVTKDMLAELRKIGIGGKSS